jgi:hypothetical protein
MEIDLETNQAEIADFIDQIQAQNFNQAKEHFDSLLNNKMSDAAEAEKINVADTIFNGAEDESIDDDLTDDPDEVEILDQEGEVIPDEDED